MTNDEKKKRKPRNRTQKQRTECIRRQYEFALRMSKEAETFEERCFYFQKSVYHKTRLGIASMRIRPLLERENQRYLGYKTGKKEDLEKDAQKRQAFIDMKRAEYKKKEEEKRKRGF